VNSREAKDFLVQQATDQAQRDGVSLCELEKRMMYFTEGEDAVENPAELNEEFEARYKTPEYETKIARLLGRAYKRLKKEDPDAAQTWDAAIKELKEGDHYLLVMWRERMVAVSGPWGFWKTMGASFVLVVVVLMLMFVWSALKQRFNIN
jgi:hypothetical protein